MRVLPAVIVTLEHNWESESLRSNCSLCSILVRYMCVILWFQSTSMVKRTFFVDILQTPYMVVVKGGDSIVGRRLKTLTIYVVHMYNNNNLK